MQSHNTNTVDQWQLIMPSNSKSPSKQSCATDDKNHGQDQMTLLKQDFSRNRSLQVLGSNLGKTSNKNSAFSFFIPQNQDDILNQKSDIIRQEWMSGDIQQDIEVVPQRKNSKDKKQHYRIQTKNLNRFFRSKINEMLRDIKDNSEDQSEIIKSSELLQRLNESNKIMFSEMREIIKDQWLQQKFQKCRGTLLRYIHKGKMGMQSKLIMLKYFNKILKAIKKPSEFTCWK